MSYTPPPGGPTGSWGPTDPYGTMGGGSPQGEAALGAPKPGSAQAQPPSQAPAPQGFPGQSAGGGAPWAGAPSGSAGPQVPPPPGGFAPTGYGAAGPVQGGYQMRPPAPGAPGSGGDKGAWIAVAAVVGVLVIALGGFGIYKLATGGKPATTAPASSTTAPPAGTGRGAPSPTAPGPSASAPPTGSGGPSPSAGGGSAAPSANAEATVLGTASMAGGSVMSEISVLPGPDDENGKKTVIVVRKLTNNSSAPIQADVYSVFVRQNGSLLDYANYPSGKDPDPVDILQWFATVQPGQEITVAEAYTLVDSSQVEIEPFERGDLTTDYTKYYWQP